MTVLVHSGRRLRGTGTVNHGSFGSKISLSEPAVVHAPGLSGPAGAAAGWLLAQEPLPGCDELAGFGRPP
jgi:hypothetical protein